MAVMFIGFIFLPDLLRNKCGPFVSLDKATLDLSKYLLTHDKALSLIGISLVFFPLPSRISNVFASKSISLKHRFANSILRIPVEYTTSSIALSLSPKTFVASGTDKIFSASSTLKTL
ncbi:hypothetical protein LEP1GSC133_4564 [Leptospira borgpetersenii serovar Pomona str. 200901868]|uniref:Uncharacterized protein n=1 Tax=Leptospira borgpetersenii serovar Pomona str. 200901868 TaxID=1192866 RepID=M6WEZ1_LEPBO|nr:hypothetical protein LEP1GSC133_4564 [Leptospira borgpetersenii serovar Pomona str. 200901868]